MNPRDTANSGRTALEEKSREIGKIIGAALPNGVGFALLLFNFGEGGNLAWISNAQRDDMMLALAEFMERNAH